MNTVASHALLLLMSPSPRTAQYRTPAVADSGVVVQIQASGRESAFRKRTDEMNGYEAPAELNHFGAAGGGLQPGAMVECVFQ